MMRLGQILLQKQWISSEQLSYALDVSTSKNLKLGETLVQLCWISDEQIEQALKEQYWRQSGYWVID
ncbi:hypothetical protein [Gloeocapsa sp. PCC 73106]|uniref:hypothetical protein n=1 Tax=Gloeocapsa sp. PCC 73106 TaxID=102232 RepID=UPI0002AC646C|nr:hypothetical protein [Gloeocapsa sp. PCC 73106]ELR99188.1 hypothetical protein GLO73106DRAFT_00030370 [Gloeocapsa sp. PCC 73106]